MRLGMLAVVIVLGCSSGESYSPGQTTSNEEDNNQCQIDAGSQNLSSDSGAIILDCEEDKPDGGPVSVDACKVPGTCDGG